MTQTLVGQPPIHDQELARRVRPHRFVDGPTRKLVRSWIQHDPPPSQIPWTPLTKPLADCRVALVSSAGIARHDQPPSTRTWSAATPGGATRAGDPSPLAPAKPTSASTTCTSTPRFGQQDLDCVLPLRRLQELCAAGLVGEVAATHYSFMGYILQPRQLLASTAPVIAARMAEEAVDVALLVPV